jgi:hypothetical protein
MNGTVKATAWIVKSAVFALFDDETNKVVLCVVDLGGEEFALWVSNFVVGGRLLEQVSLSIVEVYPVKLVGFFQQRLQCLHR